MTVLFDFIIVPLQYPFMQRAIIMAIIIGIVCAVLSCYLILKGWALMGDAISHAVLPGIILAHLLAIPLTIGAFIGGMFCAMFTGYIKENSRLKEDTVMGIVFSGMFAVGIILFTKVETDQHLNHILFGNILGVSHADIFETLLISGITLLIIITKWRDFLLYCFDPNHATAIGLSRKSLHYSLLIVLSLTIVTALKAVGIILVIAMLIAPGAIAYLLTDRFSRMLIIAVIVAISASVMGIYLSFYIDAESSASIVLIQAIVFIFVLFFAPKNGLFRKSNLQ